MQGNIPVIFVSFSGTDSDTYAGMKQGIKNIIGNIYNSFRRVLDVNLLYDTEKEPRCRGSLVFSD